MRRRLGEDEGIALVMALGITVVLIIFVTSMITFTSANGRSAQLSMDDPIARQFADGALNTAYSIIENQLSTGGNPAAANLLGCNGASGPSDTNGPSNCSSPSPKVICVTAGAGCSAGTAGSASVYGFYSGTNAQTYNGISVPASTWLLLATGYVRNPNTNATTAKAEVAQVAISPLNAGAVAAVWNHLFLTAPLTPNVCQTTFSGNSLTIDTPLYIVGNLCLAGNSDIIKEVGQPVDLQVGGKLIFTGNSTSVGVSTSTPITSGVVVGGCNKTGVTLSTTACTSASYPYYVNTTESFLQAAAPAETTSDIQNDYNTFDPGPKHPCLAGTSPAALASSAFDNDTTYNSSAATFELAPSSSYACISQNGASAGYLIWNNSGSSITVSGVTVPAHTLAINGSIFIDGNLTISQSVTYTGTGVLEVAGTATLVNNSTNVCAESPCNTNASAWQGSSGNNSMLTLVSLVSNNSSAVTLGANSQIFQGSLWTQPSSGALLNGNSATVEGPMSLGTINLATNSASLKPLPVIKNMPVGAPLPPNTGATVGPLTITR